MRHERLENADPRRAPLDEPGLGAPAGVFLLAGDYHVAPFASRAAAALRERGALLVAALHFDPLEARIAADGGVRAGAAPRLHPLRAPEDLPRLAPPPRRN